MEEEYLTSCCNANKPSKVIGLLKNDPNNELKLLNKGKLSSKFIRNTNATGVYEQIYGTCYAYAACSAYINTIKRIYGSSPPPSFGECFKIAKYNGNNGGSTKEAVIRLENYFHYGVQVMQNDNISIHDILALSVIVSFSTSKKGWYDVEKGELMKKTSGEAVGSHSALAEGYDFEKKCIICKNSWGGVTSRPRFNFIPSAAHRCNFFVVFFTIDSIRGKINGQYVPRIRTFNGTLKGKSIKCAWMDEQTATYETNYVCEYHPEKKADLNYLGYDIYKWINLNCKKKYIYKIFTLLLLLIYTFSVKNYRFSLF